MYKITFILTYLSNIFPNVFFFRFFVCNFSRFYLFNWMMQKPLIPQKRVFTVLFRTSFMINWPDFLMTHLNCRLIKHGTKPNRIVMVQGGILFVISGIHLCKGVYDGRKLFIIIIIIPLHQSLQPRKISELFLSTNARFKTGKKSFITVQNLQKLTIHRFVF